MQLLVTANAVNKNDANIVMQLSELSQPGWLVYIVTGWLFVRVFITVGSEQWAHVTIQMEFESKSWFFKLWWYLEFTSEKETMSVYALA